jgi:hypothetical protein
LPGFLVLSIHICGLRLRFLVWTLLSTVTTFPIALGTETLAGREVVPEGFDNAPNSRDGMPIELVGVEGF